MHGHHRADRRARPTPRPPFFPNAKFLFQRKEVDTFGSLHPMQWAWYVAGRDGRT